MPSWTEHAIWWQVYPLGFVGAFPAERPPGPEEHRLRRLTGWLDHAVELGASGLALGPVFASRTHGYDTTDHYRIDPRLGDDADFDHLVDQAHRRGLRVLLDGVFNHVGVDFPRYRDPAARDWFSGDTFEGHAGLIGLHHGNPEVADYVVDVMTHWLDRGADGWRLDAAYAVPQRFWADVLPRVRARFADAWFVGELIHGDYAAVVTASRFDSATQYELWKAIWSSLNDGNFFELDHALQRHNTFLQTFAPLTFVGNHDVTRIASRLQRPEHLAHALVILLTVGGVPSIYAGDEFGFRGVKEERFGGDDAVRPEFGTPPILLDAAGKQVWELHQYLIGLRRRHAWLHSASTSAVQLDNRHYVYRVQHDADSLLVALNIDDEPLRLPLPAPARLIAGSTAPPEEVIDSVVEIEAHGWRILRPS
ncbi:MULTISPECIES: alpha-amylase family glycosyl hydrolase [Mycobacterium]|uniref:Alpha-amylase n=1 Tax=Mycobacterium kiyosense TaxID=2871094 RepID=A0A9P3UXM4_9MYCO|nr:MULTISPECIES: alpha-amylase family glycosyl hydrolase [Mycobacterium]BDB42531.1 alpha-amylase [Mycobacterium kiyosense]BDE14208.1 alpha-amylase [Mycobacterium sp. 20KCMC460]GLB81576.1 alpha-amylase [Mycobacterium kiyosense]GLB89118.1 alpha-amylase [Mycobacterium kiyosense]GLB93769.1 alpha-amylase [Mycobacterium kiyosense]